MKRDTYCSQASLDAGESLFGSAPEADFWILIEYRGQWSASALTDNALPSVARQWIADQEASLRAEGLRPRTQFVKQRGRRDVPLLVAMADTRPEHRRLRGLTLIGYEEMAAIDARTILDCPDSPLNEMILVCTNGRRDACCARFGGPVYDALRKISPHTVWQTTHLGGHRFAPTVLSLPTGLCYGRIQPHEAPLLLSEPTALSANLRGRSVYSGAEQAAECHLLNSSAGAAADLELMATRDGRDNTMEVEFRDRGSGISYRVAVAVDRVAAQASCGAAETKLVARYSPHEPRRAES